MLCITIGGEVLAAVLKVATSKFYNNLNNLLLRLIAPYFALLHRTAPSGARSSPHNLLLRRIAPHASLRLLHLIASHCTLSHHRGEVLAAVLKDGRVLRYCGAAQQRAAVRPFLLGAITRCVQAQRRAVVASAISIRNTRDFILR